MDSFRVLETIRLLSPSLQRPTKSVPERFVLIWTVTSTISLDFSSSNRMLSCYYYSWYTFELGGVFSNIIFFRPSARFGRFDIIILTQMRCDSDNKCNRIPTIRTRALVTIKQCENYIITIQQFGKSDCNTSRDAPRPYNTYYTRVGIRFGLEKWISSSKETEDLKTV